MKKFEKIFAVCFILLFLIFVLAACEGNEQSTVPSTQEPHASPTEQPTEPSVDHVCSEHMWKVTVNPTCTQGGERENICECGKLFTTEKIDPLGHTAGDPATCTTAQTCIVCNIELMPTLPHTLGDEATCTTAQVCTVCNTEVVAALGHIPNGEQSCKVALMCSVCGVEIAGKLSHTLGPAATCTSPMICTVCEMELFPATGHLPLNPPSCAGPQTCAVCNEVLAEPIPHVLFPRESCTEDQVCLYCQKVVEAVGHTAGDPATCTTAQICTVCNEVVVNAYGHVIETDVAVAPTCTGTGLTEGKHCSVCLEVLVAQTVLAPRHNYVNNVCQNCGYEVDASEGLEFVSNTDGTCYVGGIGSCEATYIIIPANSPSGETVVAIGAEAFRNNTTITGIEMPDTITSIGDNAFEGCSALSYVKWSDYIAHIGSYAFAKCEALANVDLPESLVSIGEHAFYSSGITELVIPENVTSVGGHAFSFCDNLSYLRIDASITEHGNSIFYHDYNLLTVYIGEGVTYLDQYGIFDGCLKLVEVINLSSVEISKTICQYVIEVHNGESKIVNENDFLFYTYGDKNYLVGYIGDEAIISLPEGYKGENYIIKENAFYGNEDIVSVRLSKAIQKIGNYAFSGCYRLVEVIGNGYNGVLIVGREESGGVAYNAIEVHNESVSKLENIDGYLFYSYINQSGHKYNYLVAYVGDDTKLVLPESYHGETYLIHKYAFCGNDKITDVEIVNNVTSIGERAFMNCPKLTGVVINEGVGLIGKEAFANCYNLSSIRLPNSLYHIERFAFSRCTSLEEIDIPDDVSFIGACAFEGCTNLKRIELSDGLIKVEYSAFSYCTALEEIHVPDSVQYMEKQVFYGCTDLTIYCEATQKPSSWDDDWNKSGGKVVWGSIIETSAE